MSSIPFKRGCNDLVFLAPFLSVMVVTIVVAAKYGDVFVSHLANVISLVYLGGYMGTGYHGYNTVLLSSSGAKLILRIVGLSAFAVTGMSFVWIIFMILLAEALIWVTLNTITVLIIVAAVFFAKKA